MAVRGFPSALLLLGIIVTVPRAVAQNVDSVRESYIIALPPRVELSKIRVRASPGSSSVTPTAYGAEWGDVFVGAGYQARTRYSDLDDGAVVAGLGFGNSQRTIGIELALTSFTTVRDGFFTGSSLSFKLHRALTRNLTLAAGWEDAIHSAAPATDGGSSIYGVLSSYIPTRETEGAPFSSITLSGGVGGDRFQSEKDFDAGKHGVGVFGSVGVQVLSPISLLAEWTGQDLTLGASIVPFTRIPLFITPAYADVTGSAGDGARFILGVSLEWNFLRH